MDVRPVIIIGTGPAGLTAALYTGRAMMKPLVLEGHEPGGQLTLTTEVDNFPGFPEGVLGPELMANMKKQAARFGAEYLPVKASAVDLSKRPFKVTTEKGDVFHAQTIIISTGASAKWMGLPKEKELSGRGVSTCATCDGFFYRNKPVAVIGGGNTAVEEALYLSNIASHVTVVHRRDKFRAERIMSQRLLDKVDQGKVSIEWNSAVDEVLGDAHGVTGLRIQRTAGGEKRDIELHGVFVAIGHHPNTDLFEGQLEMHGGYLKVQSGTTGFATATSVPGVFAAGDCADPIYRQAVTSAGSGCQAALDADRYLESLHD
jgi:thioredoxin reductase (NADPH)